MAQYIKTEDGYNGLKESISAVTDNKMDKTNPTGTGSFSINRKAGTVIGVNSHAEGNNTTASGDSSHAEGSGTTASDYYSHAEGDNTTASGNSSHAEGTNTTASGANSHAEGSSITASGYSSHAEGSGTTASGYSSHTEGTGTIASGDYSHAEGAGTIVSGNYSHAQGRYNIKDTSNIYADIIGNGTNYTARSNAATVDWEGNAWFAGDVYTGSTSGTNKDDGSKKLATEEYVNSSIAANSVLYTAQSLTEEQKEQARKNIGAQDENNGLTPVTVTYINPFYNTTDTSTTYLLQGTLKVFDDNSPTDVKKAFAIVMNVLGGHATPTGTAGCRDLFDKFRILYDNGLITIPFKAYPNKYDRNYWVSLSAYQNKYIFFNCVRSDKADGFNVTLRYDLETNAYEENSCYSEQAIKSSLKGLTGTPTITQVQIQSDPTTDKEIATKHYVDNAPIKKASATELGGVKADSAEATDTQPVRIGGDGKLYTAAGGTDISLGLTSASVGQTIKVKAVDESGKPTEWEAADMPSGGGDNWKLLVDFESTEEIAANTGMVFDTADDGTPINAKEIIIDWYCPAASQSAYATFKVNNVQCTGYAQSAPYYFWSGDLMNSNATKAAALYFRPLMDVCLLTSNMNNKISEPVWFAKTGAFETITSLQLTMFVGTYPVGLKIKILGR